MNRRDPLTPAVAALPTFVSGENAAKDVIVFMCPYGGAKSVVAASYFNRLAAERSLPVVGIAVAAEEPYAAVPPRVAELLKNDGIDVAEFTPRHVTAEDLSGAMQIISIDCDLSHLDAANVEIVRWDDVPKISEDLPGSVSAIEKHVTALADELSKPKR